MNLTISICIAQYTIQMTHSQQHAASYSDTSRDIVQVPHEQRNGDQVFGLACVLLVKHDDVETFTRVYSAISLLHKFYRVQYTGQSQGDQLNLLSLLVLNDLSQFHSELERIPSSLTTHTLVKFPLQLEQFLMEGNFSQFFDLAKKTPVRSTPCSCHLSSRPHVRRF